MSLPNDEELEVELEEQLKYIKYAEEHTMLHGSPEFCQKRVVLIRALRAEATRLMQIEEQKQL